MIFQGYLSFGFEASNFSPCNPETLDLTNNTLFAENRIWINISDIKNHNLEPDTLYFGKIKGTLKGPGLFGHLGGSNYELDIESVIETMKVDNADCMAHVR